MKNATIPLFPTLFLLIIFQNFIPILGASPVSSEVIESFSKLPITRLSTRSPSPLFNDTSSALVLTATSTPPQSSIAPSAASSLPKVVGLRGYRRFHVNDSIVGRHVPCTHQEKLCFQYNTLFYPNRGSCLPISDDSCNFVGDAENFLRGSGHLFAMCPGYVDPCPGYRMAYDGRCYPKKIVRDVICGCEADPTPHFLGGVECRCSPSAPIHVEQPMKEGSCLIPDLRFPDNVRPHLLVNPFKSLTEPFHVSLNCSANQGKCFSQDQVWMSEVKACFTLLKRGPCPKDHVVVLDVRAAIVGWAVGVCAHKRGGCPPGFQRYVFDEKCHDEADISVVWPWTKTFTVYGQHVLELDSAIAFVLSSGPRENDECYDCFIDKHIVEVVLEGDSGYSNPHCGSHDKGMCHLYEVEDEAPLPKED